MIDVNVVTSSADSPLTCASCGTTFYSMALLEIAFQPDRPEVGEAGICGAATTIYVCLDDEITCVEKLRRALRPSGE